MLKHQLREARLAAGKTQQETADLLGVNYSTYSGYETGKRKPKPAQLQQLAAFFGVTADYLLETTNPLTEKPVPSALSENEIRLISAYRELNTTGRAAAIAAIDALTKSADLRK